MAKLNFIMLTCERKQDVVGKDEICILCDGKVQWGPRSFEKGQDRNLEPTHYEFSGSTKVTIREEDKKKSKQIGSALTVRESGSQSSHEFKTSGARYLLSYSVS